MGGKVRLRPQYKDYIALDLSFIHDNVFGSIFQVEVIFSLPLYQLNYIKDKKGPCGISNRKVYQPIQRFWVMPLSERCCSLILSSAARAAALPARAFSDTRARAAANSASCES